MAEWDILKDVLVDNLFGVVSSENGRYFAMLKEKGREAKLKRVDLNDVSKDAILINLDRYKQPLSLFKGSMGERCRCDYVLFTEFQGEKILMFVEMKSTRLSGAEVKRQFKGAECVIDYCSSAIYRFHGRPNYIDQFNKRFVCFFYLPLSKQRTRPKLPHQNNNTPEKMLKYACSKTPPPISIKYLVYANRLS